MEWRQDVDDAGDFVDAMKSEVFTKICAYAFRRRGDIIDLPADSAPIDFAYHIHTDIEDASLPRRRASTAKLVTLDYKLQTGIRLRS